MDSDWQLSCKTIQDATTYLLKSKKFTDVTFVVGDGKEVIEAHKLILMARSPVFEAMFERWVTGENCKIEVPEISGKSFQMFLKFLYGNEFIVTENEAAEVIYLAHKYDTKELATKCSDLLKSAIHIKNVIHIHQVATKLEQKTLQTQAMEFILRNGKQVVEDIGFLNIDLCTLRSILQNDKLAADELTIFRAVMRWAENKCDEQNLPLTIRNKRIALKDVIHLIRFPTMSSQEFTDEVIGKYKRILTDSETIAIYNYFTTGSTIQSGFPDLSFSKTKRMFTTIYVVNPYMNSMNSGYTEKSCRQNAGRGSTMMCERTFRFTANRNIRVTAIELFEQPAGFPEFTISIYPDDQPKATTLSKLRPSASTVFDLNDGGIDVPKGVPYAVKLECGDGQNTFGIKRSTMCFNSSIQVNCVKDSTTFSFFASSGNYHYRYGVYCICSWQIKAIHFTF